MKYIALLLVFLGLASTASADEEKGFYLGAGFGQFNVEADDIDDIGPIVQEFDSNATSFKMFGGWRFNRYLAAELDYLDFGSPDEDLNGTHVKADLSGFAPYIRGSVPIGPVEVFAKAGYLFYKLDVDVNGEKVDASSGNRDDFIVSIGAGMVVFKHIEAQLEYEYVDVSKTLDKTDALWLSAVWRF